MVNRLVASIATACAVMSAGSALAQDLPKQSFKVVGTWSNLTNWQQNEQPFWTKTLPEASKGQITANIQSLSELGLKGTEIVRLVKLGLFDFAQALPIYIAEDAIVEASTSPASPRPSTWRARSSTPMRRILKSAFEKKYGARVHELLHLAVADVLLQLGASRALPTSRARRSACRAPRRAISSRRSAPPA